MFLTNISSAQDSNFYLGIGVGHATATGDFDDYDDGIAFELDMGYRFNESLGLTLGLNSAGHTYDKRDVEATMGVATLAGILSLNMHLAWLEL